MMNPAGFEHGRIAARLARRLDEFVERHALGIVVGAETGFLIQRDPDTVRAADAAWVAADRLPTEPVVGYFPGAPDLAVEVLSPNDRANEVLGKVHAWLAAGCRIVWLVDPGRKTASIYRLEDDRVVSQSADTLTAEELLPGFAMAVDDLFARP